MADFTYVECLFSMIGINFLINTEPTSGVSPILKAGVCNIVEMQS